MTHLHLYKRHNGFRVGDVIRPKYSRYAWKMATDMPLPVQKALLVLRGKGAVFIQPLGKGPLSAKQHEEIRCVITPDDTLTVIDVLIPEEEKFRPAQDTVWKYDSTLPIEPPLLLYSRDAREPDRGPLVIYVLVLVERLGLLWIFPGIDGHVDYEDVLTGLTL